MISATSHCHSFSVENLSLFPRIVTATSLQLFVVEAKWAQVSNSKLLQRKLSLAKFFFFLSIFILRTPNLKCDAEPILPPAVIGRSRPILRPAPSQSLFGSQ